MATLHNLLTIQLLIIILSIHTATCLPVTSKPIENTPEHLAWEAWIMVPPTHDKTRKITPKSIFILPNKTNGGVSGGPGSQQIQCPPGHRVDNFKCIPTISIDRDQILITQLTNLLHSTDKYNTNSDGSNNSETNYSYEYDYDYGDMPYDADGTQAFSQVGGGVPPDYNGEPLKINLSLDKFPNVRDDSKDTGNVGVFAEDSEESNYDEFKVQPFRAEETKATTNYASRFGISDRTQTTTTTTNKNNQESSSRRENETVTSQLDVKNDQRYSNVHFTTVTARNTTSTVPILSASESEMSSVTATTKDDNDELDYTLSDQTTSQTTTMDDSEMDLVTDVDDSKTDFREELLEDSLVLDRTDSTSTTEFDESTESTDSTTTIGISPEPGLERAETSVWSGYSRYADRKPEKNMPKLNENQTFGKVENISRTGSGYRDGYRKPSAAQTNKHRGNVEVQDDVEPLMESIESNNRFVYHHLGSPSLNRQPPSKVETTTQDIQEQLRIINQIVEENKRRSQQYYQQQQSRIRFPDDRDPPPSQNVGSLRDYVRFPQASMSHEPEQHPTIDRSNDRHHQQQQQQHQLYRNRQISDTAMPTTISSSSTTSEMQKTAKPFWWLPTGWEIDQNGDKPLLLRFWSRMPNNQESTARYRSSAATTTSGYRENSKSPTESLYKEVSAQEVYKVLGAKQWKHNNR